MTGWLPCLLQVGRYDASSGSNLKAAAALRLSGWHPGILLSWHPGPFRWGFLPVLPVLGYIKHRRRGASRVASHRLRLLPSFSLPRPSVRRPSTTLGLVQSPWKAATMRSSSKAGPSFCLYF